MLIIQKLNLDFPWIGPLAITLAMAEGNIVAKATADGKIVAKAIAEHKIIAEVVGQINVKNFERSYLHYKWMFQSGEVTNLYIYLCNEFEWF